MPTIKRRNYPLLEGKVDELENKVKDQLEDIKHKLNHNGEKDEEFLKLTELVESSRILFHTKTVFPFDFFPDDFIIDRDKVAIITHYFFASSSHRSILIKNISDVYIENSIFFSTLYITDKYFADNNIKIDYLWRKNAVRARDIIQGLIICFEKKVDISNLKRSELLPYLEEIGRATAN